MHPRIVLYDCHSIRSVIPRLFEGELPVMNIGTNSGAACAPELQSTIASIAGASDFTHVVNGRFKGGYITRHYGSPAQGVHAVQMELACRGYMHETPGPVREGDWPTPFDPDYAAPIAGDAARHPRNLPRLCQRGHAMTRIDNARTIRAPRGTELSAKSWLTEAPLRMLMNNLDPEVAEKPGELVVYGGIGRAARDWESFDRIVAALRKLEADETLLVQSGKPVGVFRTHADAPRVLIANSNIVPHWATLEHFNELDRKGLMMYGQMTAGSWIYIGSQGIVQGTYETFVEVGRRHYGGSLAGKWILDRRPRRHGRGAAAGGRDGGRLHAGGGMPAEPDRDAPQDRVSRRSSQDPR